MLMKETQYSTCELKLRCEANNSNVCRTGLAKAFHPFPQNLHSQVIRYLRAELTESASMEQTANQTKAHWANHQLSFRTLTGLHRKEISGFLIVVVKPCINCFLHFWLTLEIGIFVSLKLNGCQSLACTVLRLESPMALTRPTLSRSCQVHQNSSPQASCLHSPPLKEIVPNKLNKPIQSQKS